MQSLNKFECTQACSLQFFIISLSSLNISLTFFQISFYPPLSPPFHPLLPFSPPFTFTPLSRFLHLQPKQLDKEAMLKASSQLCPGKGSHFSHCTHVFQLLASLSIFPQQNNIPWDILARRKSLQGISAGLTCEGLPGGSWLPWPTGSALWGSGCGQGHHGQCHEPSKGSQPFLCPEGQNSSLKTSRSATDLLALHGGGLKLPQGKQGELN